MSCDNGVWSMHRVVRHQQLATERTSRWDEQRSVPAALDRWGAGWAVDRWWVGGGGLLTGGGLGGGGWLLTGGELGGGGGLRAD